VIILKKVVQCLERVPVGLEAYLNRVNPIALDGQPQLGRFVPGISQRPVGYLTYGVLSSGITEIAVFRIASGLFS
jgi:hypothetical protein